MAFSPQFLDELRLRTGLADLIGKRVRLTHKGNEHQGLCPFHKEKTPSFTLNEEKGFYHCFGCGAHGSAIDFVMNMDGLSFPEAVERLAGDAGMEVPVDSPEERENAKKRQTLYDVVEAAAAYFEQQLRMPEGRTALDYLKGRGLDDGTIAKFRLGFAPDGHGALKTALRRLKISDDQMVAAGLLIQPEDAGREAYDRFRNRVIFPITDKRGRVIAFGGRIMAGDDDKKLAKYLNSPETALFHKGNVLYNLALAAKSARQQGTVIVTEGYMDVIALAQAGFEHAVAPLGTALTEQQIVELWKLVREPVMCFDGDNAGMRAQGRAAERALALLKPGYALRFATLPQGEDPDSLIANQGRQAMANLIEKAEPLSEVLWKIETGGRLPKTPEQRAALQKALEDHARSITDPTVRAHFSKDFRDRVWAASGRSEKAGKRVKTMAPTMGIGAGAATGAKIDAHALRERILLATVLGHPGLYDTVGERLGGVSFSAPGLDNLRQEVLKTLAGEPDLDSEGVKRHLKENGYSEILDFVLMPEVIANAFFVKPGTDIETALEGWEETYALYRNTDLGIEIEEERDRLKDDMSSENFNRFNSLSEQKLEAAKGIEDEQAGRTKN
ncbi:MAG: DNA primase [Rhodospirillaceae bacterium]|nr:DNA primase [Rhodospirillaceae bacterium]